MSKKKSLFVILVAGVILLALGAGSRPAGSASAVPPNTTTIPYSGRLSLASSGDPNAGSAADLPVADGAYDLRFALFAAQSGGQALWSEEQSDVTVRGGVFAVSLGSVEPVPAGLLSGQALWLAIAVRGPGEVAFTALSPRQQLSDTAGAEPSGTTVASPCEHDHFGEWWVGDGLVGLLVSNASSGATSVGVFGTGTTGVLGIGTTGVKGSSSDGPGVYAEGEGGGNTRAALRANALDAGCGIAAYLTSNSGCPALEIDKTGYPGSAIDIQLFNSGNYNPAHYISGYNDIGNLVFQVASSGVVFASGYIDYRADLADMLPAVEGLEPADVLVIGPDGKLTRSSAAHQTNVAGVYSTAPGYVGGQPLEGPIPGTIPLSLAGVVPTKVSAENGAIQPGDLLVTSATPGHAMKAGPNPPQGSVIGKALEAWEQGSGTITILVTLQ